jgi:hypothetical protein
MAWWAVPEGFLGDTVNALTDPFSDTRVHYHAVSSATKPNAQSYGPYGTKLQAQAEANTLNAGAQPLAASTDVSNAANSLAPLGDIGDFFHRLTEGSTWTRVGEVALGGILLYAGLRAMSHGSSVAGSGARKAATKPVKTVAKKAAKVAVPEARLASRVAAKKVAPKTTARVASHRAQVAKYGGKRPVGAPKPAVRTTHIYYHKAKP